MSTRSTKSKADELRAELRKICDRRARGDLKEKAFQRALADRTVDLFRAVVQERLAEGEDIFQEHHTIQAHFKLTQSVLKEPFQLATSLFATNRRLIRLRAMIKPNAPVNADESEQTVIDEVEFTHVREARTIRQIRLGEIGAGLIIAALAFLGQSWLSITGPFMLALGLLGVAHGLLLPNRWVEIVTAASSPADDPICIYALRKKSAKELVKYVRARIFRAKA